MKAIHKSSIYWNKYVKQYIQNNKTYIAEDKLDIQNTTILQIWQERLQLREVRQWQADRYE